MKPYLYSLIAAAAFTGLASAQTNAYTTPVGYYEYNGLAGGNIVVPGFVNTPVFSGDITADSATTLTVAVNAIVANAFNETPAVVGPPAIPIRATHYVEITEGPNQGVVIDIESNTNSVITLAADITGLALVGTENIKIRPHVTLAGVFASGEDDLLAENDSVTFFEPSGQATTYFYAASGNWTTDFSAPDGSTRPIPPGTGFVLDISSPSAITFTGEVKSSDTVVQVTGGGVVNIVGPVNPLVGNNDQLANLGFVGMTPEADSITMFTPGNLIAPIGTFFSTGTILTEDFENPSTVTIPFTTGGVLQAAGDGALRIQSGL